MNRGVMVTRVNPDTNELENSARGICSNTSNDPVLLRLSPLLRPLCEAYQAVCDKLKKDFFGLRDFYSLIKMLYWMCGKNEAGQSLTWQQVEHAVRRNFGGEDFEPITEFEKKIRPYLSDAADLSSISIMNPDCTTLGLIRTSLMNKEKTWHGENRYLLFLTENYAALHILHHYLTDTLKCVSTSGKAIRGKILEPFVLFGSSFPKDKEYTQYYIEHGENRYVDLGLQTHRVKCRVHENFKLIMIAEKKTVYSKFPTPLINRLEKHFVLASSVLTEIQKDVLKEIEEWVEMFSTVKDHNSHKSFCEAEAFIGYQRDTAAAVVFQATTSLIDHVKEHIDKEAVLKKSKHLLLQTASPDAVIRLEVVSPADFKDLEHAYTSHQYYDCLSKFLKHHISGTVDNGTMMQVTTHGHLLSSNEVEIVTTGLCTNDGHSIITSNFFLQDFDTELAFSNKIGASFEKRVGERVESLLIVQCESGHLDGDLIACARYRIIDERTKVITNALNKLVSSLCAEEGTLIRKIAALHTVYSNYKQHITWFGHLMSCFPAILRTLKLSSPNYQGSMESSPLFITVSRQWHRIRVLQLFVEHLVIKFKDMMPFANRLNLALRGDEPDIFSNKVIMSIKTALDSMVSQLEKERNEKDGTQDISTRQISPYKGETDDRIPIVRSFLLQLLLDNSTSSSILQKYIDDYFIKAQKALSAKKIHDLYLLFTHCYENEEIIDEFVIYGDKYSQIQEQVSRTIYGGMVQQHEIMPKHTPCEVTFLVLAICNVSITAKVRNHQFSSDAIKILEQTLKTFKAQFPENMYLPTMPDDPLYCDSSELDDSYSDYYNQSTQL
eukprot:Em0021g573a